MTIATTAAKLLQEVGVSADDILAEAGVNRKTAIKQLAEQLGVDLTDFVPAPTQKEGQAVEITDADVNKVREGLAVLNRAFG